MENASKALIIAGAILLAIVIISLGLIVVNNVRSTVDNTNLSEQEIQSFNAKFTAYEGASVSGSRVNSLIQTVIATNQANLEKGESHFVTVIYPNGGSSTPYTYFTYKSDGPHFQNGSEPTDDSNAVKGNDNFATDTNKGTPTLSVATGKNYKVKCYYKDGLVKCITVI